MATVRLSLARDQVAAGVRRAVDCLTGRAADPTGAVRDLQLALGVAVLGCVQENFRVQSEGGSGDLNTGPWEPLAASTLALRRKSAGAKVIARLQKDFASLPAARQRLVAVQFARASTVYRADQVGSMTGREARRAAKGILERMRKHISPTRYKTLSGELRKDLKPERADRLALAAAHSIILRDEGLLFNSLGPALRGSGDQVLRVESGAVVVGTNRFTAKYHNSSRARKQKKTGGPRLPRRQFLPDETHPMPPSWWKAATDALSTGLNSAAFWQRFLSA